MNVPHRNTAAPLICLLALLIAGILPCIAPSGLFAAENAGTAAVSGNVAVFTVPQESPAINALASESLAAVTGTFNRLGRFLPVERNSLAWALGDSLRSGDVSAFEKAAKKLNADLYVVLSFSEGMRITYADMTVRALNPAYSRLEKTVRLRSRIPRNLPLKLAREVALAHRGVELNAVVRARYPDGLILIDAGRWHGLSEGTWRTSAGRIGIVSAGNYESLARAEAGAAEGTRITFPVTVRAEKAARDIEALLARNAIAAYGIGPTLMHNGDDEARFIEGLCLINPGGNVCLPGYGAYLSTAYLGFEGTPADITGVSISAADFVFHLALPPLMTGFRGNFFPWVSDTDKSENVRRLQIFLWGTIPFNFTVAYLDQLAYMFHRTEHLPSFFAYHDVMAGLLSAAVPGGGLFYKGYRFGGWAYYFSEIGLAGYAVYNWESGRKGKYALAALGGIKLIEVLNAVLIRPSYRFYNLEVDREPERASLSFGTYMNGDREAVYGLSVIRGF